MYSILGKQLNHQDRRNMTENLSSDSMEILSQVLEEMKREKGSDFILREVNLSELVRRTGISRKKLRNLKKNKNLPSVKRYKAL